jgi:putative addiction module killer protein
VIEVLKTKRFDAWLVKLRDERGKALITFRLLRLQQGLFGDVKPVGAGVSELRINHGPGYRVYLCQRGEKLILILCGGDKSSQDRDISEAKTLAKEIRI